MLLALKLFLTPILITAATLVGRRWGPGVSGWLIGFPLTSAPVSIVLALQYGPGFASQAAVGTIAGEASVCIFCAVYILISYKGSWWVSAAFAIIAFLVSIMVWNRFTLSLLPTFAIICSLITLLLLFIPSSHLRLQSVPMPSWDIPARIIIAVTFVFVLTSAAAFLGPQLSGLLSPFPIFGVVLAAFAHQQQGSMAARQLLRGNIIGAYAFAVFFLVVGALLPGMHLIWTYSLAALAALFVNGATLRFTHQKEIPLYVRN